MAEHDEPAVAAPTAQQRREAEAQAKQRVPHFTVARLLADPEVVESSAAVMAGALYGMDPDEELTGAEALKLAEKFGAREVQNDIPPIGFDPDDDVEA